MATNAGHHAMLAGRDVQGLAAAEAGIVMPNADGEPVGRLARLDDIELGRIYDRDAVCAVVNGADFSALGCDFWRQYRVTFDFPRDLIYLGKRANTPPSEATMSGLIFFRQDRSKIVYHVFPGSPADKAGVLKGDRLTRLDGKAADEMLLSEIRAAQRSGVDKKVEMQFDRDGRQIEASVTLRRLL
ncbi:MAG TPA: PDZ domain-containing protein [Pirellulales bacterium]|nr:PDZ domain-containing protein [Pirellulales bacterium]